MTGWSDNELSVIFAGGYFALLGMMWILLVLGAGRWGKNHRIDQPTSKDVPPQDQQPLVSVCIPARNEEMNIGTCLKAVLRSDWHQLECIVVDDRSSDATQDKAREAAQNDTRFRLVAGSPPAAGWAGKPWACARAAGEATGEFLLFVDADVQLHPMAIPALIHTAEANKLDLLSAFGTWELVGFWEKTVIPVVGWLIRGSIDLKQVNDPSRTPAFANGQLILIRSSAYTIVDGHSIVARELLEDVRLAEAFKRRGLKPGLRLAPWLFHVRLYRNLTEIIQGYSKNLYEGMGRRPTLGLGAVLFIMVGTLLPWAILLMGPALHWVLGWQIVPWSFIFYSFGIALLQLLFRFRIERADGRSGSWCWSHALGNIVLAWILLRSVLGVRSKWKGRTFVDGRAN